MLCRPPLVAASRGYSLVAVPGLLIAVASLVEEHRLLGAQASVVMVQGAQLPCGISDQGSNPCPLHWEADSYPLCHQGSLFLSLRYFK